MNIEKYLLPFLKKENIKFISDAKLVGSIRGTNAMIEKIRFRPIEIDETIKLMEKKDFDVRLDDLINVYNFHDTKNDYYIFIFEPLELYSKSYLVRLFKIVK